VAEAEQIAQASGDRSLQVRAIYMGAYVRSWFDAAGEAAVQELRRGLALAEELDDPAVSTDGQYRLATLLYNSGQLLGAEDELVRCRATAAVVASRRDEARATFLLGLVKYHLGQYDEAEQLGLQALDWLDRTGDSFYTLQTLRTLALCAAARSDLALAEARLRQVIPLAVDVGGMIIDLYRILVEVLLAEGRRDDARELSELGLNALPNEDPYARAAGLLMRGSIAAADGLRDEASESFVEACALLEQQRLPLDLGEGRLAYGRALRQLGDSAGAERQLRQARNSVAALGARGLVDRLDRELAQIEGAEQVGPLASS
jgi:tetratricopeptide (TPR) repeat protein